jgi:poly(3-hydroxybutyrate) depolymerase
MLTSSALPTSGGGPGDNSAGYKTIMSGGEARKYMLTMPPNYDMNKAYRFMYVSHYSGGDGDDMAKTKYHGVQGIAEANESSIWVAASGIGGAWGLKDVPLFDDILAFVKQNACIDESRVFVYGFSFGGMYSYSLSMTRQKVIRAAIGMAAANFNIQVPTKAHDPIAYMGSTGVNDPLCVWDGGDGMKGAKYIALEHAKDNGCTIPADIPTWKSGSPPIFCYEFQGCRAGFPVKACTWNGAHDLPPMNAPWIWEFVTQF